MMSLTKFATAFLLPLLATAAQLPELRTEPIGGGSVFFVKNTSPVPAHRVSDRAGRLPGQFLFTVWQDEITGEPLPPSGERRIQVTNMTAGAVPDLYEADSRDLRRMGRLPGSPKRSLSSWSAGASCWKRHAS